MPVIHTKTNWVTALEPAEDDRFCQVLWLGPGDLNGLPHAKQFSGPVEPIENYQECVEWAVGIADQMRFPVYVLPLSTHEGFVEADTQPDWHGPELRRMGVDRWAKMMLDSDDRARRQLAYDMLTNLGVVTP